MAINWNHNMRRQKKRRVPRDQPAAGALSFPAIQRRSFYWIKFFNSQNCEFRESSEGCACMFKVVLRIIKKINKYFNRQNKDSPQLSPKEWARNAGLFERCWWLVGVGANKKLSSAVLDVLKLSPSDKIHNNSHFMGREWHNSLTVHSCVRDLFH